MTKLQPVPVPVASQECYPGDLFVIEAGRSRIPQSQVILTIFVIIIGVVNSTELQEHY